MLLKSGFQRATDKPLILPANDPRACVVSRDTMPFYTIGYKCGIPMTLMNNNPVLISRLKAASPHQRQDYIIGLENFHTYP